MDLRKQCRRTATALAASFVLLGMASISKADFEHEYVGQDGASFGGRATYFKPKDGDGAWGGGAQLRVYPGKAVGIEGSVDYRRETFGDTRVDIYPVQLSLLLYLVPRKPLNFFLLGGGGWYYTHIDNPAPADDSTTNRFGAHAGAGVQLHLNDFWSFDATYRYIWLEDLKSKDATLADKNFKDNGSMVTIGLNYQF